MTEQETPRRIYDVVEANVVEVIKAARAEHAMHNDRVKPCDIWLCQALAAFDAAVFRALVPGIAPESVSSPATAAKEEFSE